MEEIWKDIEGYEGLYQVSSCGRVKSLGNGKSNNSTYSNERILKPKQVSGYLRTTLCKKGEAKQFSIHRLVAEAFIKNPHNYIR